MNSDPKIICEIGGNHKGQFELAKEMVKIASNFCDVDVIKFQKRNNRELLSEDEFNKPHPNPEHSYGETYGAHRENLEFNIDQHKELKKYCESFNKIYSSSVWDITSANEIASLNPSIIKIPSAMNLNFPLLSHICKIYNGEIHLSLGMTFEKEIAKIIDFFENKNKLNNLVIYYCKSSYPAYEEKLNLNQISKLKSLYGDKIKSIGFSGHHPGISIDVAAYTVGAEYFERHFTLSKDFEGPDHILSSEPNEMKKLVDFAKSSNSILGDGVKIIQQSEYATINSQRKSLYASKDITTGEKITYNNITVKGPGGGILPKYIDIIINRKTKKKILEDHPITWDDI